MPIELTNRELIVFFGALVVALFIFAGGAAGWFDPLTGGIIILTLTALFVIGEWLESKGIFGKGATMVWLVFGLGIVAVISGLIARGILPLAFYTSSTPFLVLAVSNAMLYSLLILAIVALAITVYFAKKKQLIPIR